MTTVAFSPDGRRLASASFGPHGAAVGRGDGSGGPRLKGHTGLVTAVAFSPDGKRLASASYDKTVRLWDPDTGQEVRALKGHTDGVRRWPSAPMESAWPAAP